MSQETITARLDELIENLNLLPTGEERLLYLVSLGKKYPAMDSTLKIAEHLLVGCVSQLWIVAQRDTAAGTLHFVMDADATISKGIAAALCNLYNGETPADILAIEPNFFAPTGLSSLISPNRSNALANLRRFVVNQAKIVL